MDERFDWRIGMVENVPKMTVVGLFNIRNGTGLFRDAGGCHISFSGFGTSSEKRNDVELQKVKCFPSFHLSGMNEMCWV